MKASIIVSPQVKSHNSYMDWYGIMSRIEPIVDSNGVPTPEYMEAVTMENEQNPCQTCGGSGMVVQPDGSVAKCPQSPGPGHY